MPGTQRPGGTAYSKLSAVIEIVVTAPAFAKRLVVYNILSEPQSNPQNFTKDTDLQIQEAEQNSNRRHSKESAPRHVTLKRDEN